MDDTWSADVLDGADLPAEGDADRSPAAEASGSPLPQKLAGEAVSKSSGTASQVLWPLWLGGASCLALFAGALYLFATRMQRSPSDQQPDGGAASARAKRPGMMSKSNTMQSSVSIRSDRSAARSGVSGVSPRRAGKLLSDKCRGRRASAVMEPRARLVPSTPPTTEPRMGVMGTEPGSSVVQHVSSQRAGFTGSAGNLSVGGLSGVSATSASVDSSFPIGPAAASGTGGTGYTPGDCRFLVPVDTLVEAADEGSFNITDQVSGLLLRVGIMNLQDGTKSLQIFVGKDAMTPCTTVRPVQGSPEASHNMEIRGANGLHFGMLTLQPNGSFVVTTAEQQPLLVVEGNEANLDLRISARDGRLVAAVSCCESSPSKGVEHVEFRVFPGTDPLLVISCILSVLLLGGDDEDE